MKKFFIVSTVLISFASSLYALDEDTYVRFVSDSIVVAHNLKSNPDGARLWSQEMSRMYPGVTTTELRSFEAVLAGDGALRGRVYNRILENVRSKGYRAHISTVGAGSTAVEIED